MLRLIPSPWLPETPPRSYGNDARSRGLAATPLAPQVSLSALDMSP